MGKREDILESALDLIDEEGLQSATIAKILKRAGVGSGTLFNYFDTKEELVNEVYRTARRRMSERMLDGYDAQAGLYERFKKLQMNRLRFAVNFPKEFMMIDTYSYSPYISAELRNMEDASAAEVEKLIREGQQLGIVAEMEVKLCHQIVSGLISSIAKGCLIGKYAFDDELCRRGVEASWKAIRL